MNFKFTQNKLSKEGDKPKKRQELRIMGDCLACTMRHQIYNSVETCLMLSGKSIEADNKQKVIIKNNISSSFQNIKQLKIWYQILVAIQRLVKNNKI